MVWDNCPSVYISHHLLKLITGEWRSPRKDLLKPVSVELRIAWHHVRYGVSFPTISVLRLTERWKRAKLQLPSISVSVLLDNDWICGTWRSNRIFWGWPKKDEMRITYTSDTGSLSFWPIYYWLSTDIPPTINCQHIGRVSAAISTDISAYSRSICRPSLGRHLGWCIGRYVNRHTLVVTSAESWSICRHMSICTRDPQLCLLSSSSFQFAYLWTSLKKYLKTSYLKNLYFDHLVPFVASVAFNWYNTKWHNRLNY